LLEVASRVHSTRFPPRNRIVRDVLGDVMLILRLLRDRTSLALLLMASGCATSVETAEEPAVSSQELSLRCEPSVPSTLAAPEGHKLARSLDASGAQIYACLAGATGELAWTLKAPDAELYRRGKLFGTHYAGPTWEALDGSKVVGARVAGYTADPSAIPWLLLSATSSSERGAFSGVSFIQRVNTVGGLAPTGGCDAAHADAEVSVDYTATYHFYKAARR
jgi:hypothetical protein